MPALLWGALFAIFDPTIGAICASAGFWLGWQCTETKTERGESDSWQIKSWRPMVQDYKWTRRLSNDELFQVGYEGRVYALAISVYHFPSYNTITIILKIGKIDLKWRIERKISNQNSGVRSTPTTTPNK